MDIISLSTFQEMQNAASAQSNTTVMQANVTPCGCSGKTIEQRMHDIAHTQKVCRLLHMVLIVLVICFLYKNTFGK